MLDKVSALGLEAMEIGIGGYPHNHHCPLDDLIQDKAQAKAWQKKFADKGLHIATFKLSRQSGASQRAARAKRYRYFS